VNESQQQHPQNVYHDISVTRNKIVTAQFECYQKIMKDNNQDVIPSRGIDIVHIRVLRRYPFFSLLKYYFTEIHSARHTAASSQSILAKL